MNVGRRVQELTTSLQVAFTFFEKERIRAFLPSYICNYSYTTCLDGQFVAE
jgi:hypothetical protein